MNLFKYLPVIILFNIHNIVQGHKGTRNGRNNF